MKYKSAELKKAKAEEERVLIDLWMQSETVEAFIVKAEAQCPAAPSWKLALFRLYGFFKRHRHWNLPFALAGYLATTGVELSFGLYSSPKNIAAAMLLAIPTYIFLRVLAQCVFGALLFDRLSASEEGRYYKIGK